MKISPLTVVQYWVIRKKGTRLYFPAIPANAGNPTALAPKDITDSPPRLFMTRAAASKALGFWVRGSVSKEALAMGVPRREDPTGRRLYDFEIIPVEANIRPVVGWQET